MLANAAAAREVLAAFGDAGIDVILLKGASFAAWLYATDEFRPQVDEDLLVRPGDITRAEELLASLGFLHAPLDDLQGDKPWHAHAWIRARDGAAIDLHRTLLGARVPAVSVWSTLWSTTEPLRHAGTRVCALDETGRCLHVALHAAQGGSSTGKALEDLRRAVDRADRQTWRQAHQLAVELQAVEAFAAGLRLVEPGSALADELGLPRSFAPDVELRRRNAPGEAVGLARFLSLPSRQRLRWTAAKLFPPRAFMHAWDPRSRRGPGRLLLAYPRRWLWLLRRLPTAVSWWWRARRSRDVRR